MNIEILDTTLREGEQTNGVSFSPEEKLAMAKKLLTEVSVDRIEIGNARVSDGEKEAIRRIASWAKEAGLLDRLEVLGFVDDNLSVDWIAETGCRVMNLLAKGSLKHCTVQLKKTSAEHFKDIRNTIRYAQDKGMDVNVYLEDWSSGISESPEYVMELTRLVKSLKVKRVMLPDTLGTLNFIGASEFMKKMACSFPDLHFDIHAHNDYGLATANSIAAVLAGARGVHTTVNCMGERAGNAALDEVAIGLADFFNYSISVNEKKLKEISRLVEAFSGKRISSGKPITGDDVFTQTAGIHADGDRKGNLYSNKLHPSRFNRERAYALGKLSGKANIDLNLIELNIDLDDDTKKAVYTKVVELGDKKKVLTKDDLPFIISDVLKSPKDTKIQIVDYEITSWADQKPFARLALRIGENEYYEKHEGDGGYDAFMNCLKKLEPKLDFRIPTLIDYVVRIPPGGNTDALVETTITWKNGGSEFKTVGVDCDQIVAAIKSTEKMLNIMELKKLKKIAE
ncbi:MAG: 2-isopropylmalate synthase [Nanoarchaeota archaeon]|nr:2-isopropylmalate synthase [Nanoarchaeota archaeon]